MNSRRNVNIFAWVWEYLDGFGWIWVYLGADSCGFLSWILFVVEGFSWIIEAFGWI